MEITALNDDERLSFAKVLLVNELNNQISLKYKFSYAGGKSGLSFGISQLDICNNAHALLCLRDCSFTTDEVAYLKTLKSAQGLDSFNARLLTNNNIVDKYDRAQINDCETWSLILCNEIHVNFSTEESFIAIADYNNQFGFSRGGKMYQYLKFLKSFSGALTPEMVRDFKYTLPYGIEQKAKPQGTTPHEHDDVWRRYANIAKVMGRTV